MVKNPTYKKDITNEIDDSSSVWYLYPPPNVKYIQYKQDNNQKRMFYDKKIK